MRRAGDPLPFAASGQELHVVRESRVGNLSGDDVAIRVDNLAQAVADAIRTHAMFDAFAAHDCTIEPLGRPIARDDAVGGLRALSPHPAERLGRLSCGTEKRRCLSGRERSGRVVPVVPFVIPHSRFLQHMCCPPLIAMFAPVINAAESDAR